MVYNIIMSNRMDKIREIIETNRNSSVSPLDVFNPKTEWVDESISGPRFAICQACPEFIKLSSQCKKCGCLMAVKTKLEKAECPIGKW
jgi:hypothetical protein